MSAQNGENYNQVLGARNGENHNRGLGAPNGDNSNQVLGAQKITKQWKIILYKMADVRIYLFVGERKFGIIFCNWTFGLLYDNLYS